MMKIKPNANMHKDAAVRMCFVTMKSIAHMNLLL